MFIALGVAGFALAALWTLAYRDRRADAPALAADAGRGLGGLEPPVHAAHDLGPDGWAISA